jgi:hypothetical protein
MSKMRTLSLCEENREEIMSYVMNDSLAIAQIHKKFKKSIREIIAQYVDAYISKHSVKCENLIIPQRLENNLSNDHTTMHRAIYKALKGQFAMWTTISSVSRTIFSRFFCNHTLQSPRDA